VYESKILLVMSNVVFSTAAALLVVALISRSFLARGTPDLLLFGCGVLLWGAAGTVGPALMTPGGNVAISTHNILACLSAFCQLTGTLLALKPPRPFNARHLPLALSYLGVLAVVLLVILLVVNGWTPLFFLQGEGGTLLRQIVLVSTIVMFSGAAAILRESDRQVPKVFAKWYALSLLLTATGLFGVLLQTSHGSALNWTARVAQFLGGAYMLVAAYASLSDPRRRINAPLLAEEPPGVEFLAKLRQQTPLGIVLRYALSVVVLASAMGLRLMLEAWGGYGLPTYITFYPAVMSVALLVGFGPGLLATVLAALAAIYWLMQPIGQFAAASTIDRVGVVFFLGMGLFMCLIAELYRRNRDKVAAYDREAALRESEKRLALAASATRIGMFEWDITSGRVYLTQTHEAIFGYAPVTAATTTTTATITATTEHDYHKLVDRIHQDDLPLVEAELLRCVQERNPLEVQYRIIWPDGSLHWVETKGVLQHDSDGTAIRMLGVIMDITERKRADEALRANRERLELALSSSKMATFDWDIVKGRRTWSDGVHSLLGTKPETFTGSAEEFFQIIHPADRSTVQAALAKAVESTGLYMTEYRAVWPDGSIHHISARGKVQYDNSGRPVLMTGICWDITKHKQAEKELQKANEELEARVTERTRELATALQTLQIETAERIHAAEVIREKEQMLIQQSRLAAMGEMIGNIAHQWRQPLNVLALQVQQLLMMYDYGKFTRESLNCNVSSSMDLIQHMSRTIDDFRNYFRPDKGKTEFELSGVITNTLTLIEDSFKNDRISIEIMSNDDPVITGYRNEFAQVILNILNNARDVLIEREISDPRVTISLSAEGDRAIVSIADNAGGVPEEIMGKIFGPYFTTKGPQTGTGVGLFMSKSIIEKNMGGRITVRNTADGAEFRIEV